MQEMRSQRSSGVQSITPGLSRHVSSVSASTLLLEKMGAPSQPAIVSSFKRCVYASLLTASLEWQGMKEQTVLWFCPHHLNTSVNGTKL